MASPEFTVKDGFTMPARSNVGRKAHYPFATLSMGQTAMFKPKSKRDITRIRAAVSKVSSEKGLRFMTRTLSDGGFAVQRIRAKSS